jgi:nitroreductase
MRLSGLIFTIDGALTKHSWLDCGLFVQSVILAAQVRGLSTCPQVSFVRFQTLIAERIGLRPGELVTCGMSLGYAEAGHPVNELNMPRESLDKFTRWLGFEE